MTEKNENEALKLTFDFKLEILREAVKIVSCEESAGPLGIRAAETYKLFYTILTES
jgi:hypothetical protein